MAILDDTREDWNARPPTHTRTVVPWPDRVGVSWHWIGPGYGPAATGPHAACLKQVRDWQAQHQANGWKDIGYNALVCQHARAIEGRGLEFSGSHSPGVNYEHVGVQFMVGERSGFPTPAMIARAQTLRADVGRLGKNIRRDWSHRDDPEASTECAGDEITKWVHSGGPTAPQEDDDMPSMDELKAELLTKADGAQLRKDIGFARDQMLAATNPTKLAAALAPALAAALPAGTTVTDEQLEAALRTVLGSLDKETP